MTASPPDNHSSTRAPCTGSSSRHCGAGIGKASRAARNRSRRTVPEHEASSKGASSRSALPSPLKPSLSLTTARINWGCWATNARQASSRPSMECTSSEPAGWGRPQRRNNSRPPDLLPHRPSAGSHPRRGICRVSERRCSSRPTLKQLRKLRSGRRVWRIRSKSRGRSSSFSAKGRGLASSVSKRCSRCLAWEIGTPGNSSSTESTTRSGSNLLVTNNMRALGCRKRINSNS